MPYIARTDGGQDILQWREGQLSDLAPDDQPNWRQVVEVYNPTNPIGQIRGTPSFTVSANGSTVAMTWAPFDMPTWWAAYKLKAYADQIAAEKMAAGLSLPNGVKLGTTDSSLLRLLFGFVAGQAGMISAPVDALATSGWLSLQASDFAGAFGAIWQRGVAIYAAWKAVYDAIDAGSITTQAQIDAYSW